MKTRLVGFLILVIVAAGVFWFKQRSSVASDVVLKGLVGGEKTGLLDDAKVKGILKRRYGITLDWSKAGSFEMVGAPLAGMDFLWPSSQGALEVFRTKNPTVPIKSDVIFNSPLVLYSWDIVADALEKQGVVVRHDSAYWIADFPKLAAMVVAGRKWSEIGLPTLYGRMGITTTDPALSNSGNMFAGLLANVLAGDVVTDSTVESVLPRLKRVFKALGYMERSSSDLFLQYLNTGVGAKPMIAGYESQIVEFSVQNASSWPTIRKSVRILYPEPTVWSAHPLIAITPGGKRLLDALKDPEIQKIAWEQHGFRTGLAEMTNDPKLLSVVGIPPRITRVVALPDARVMERIVSSLQSP